MALEYLTRVCNLLSNRRFFVLSTPDGFRLHGLAPSGAQGTDTVCILHGCSVPIALRKRKDCEASWELIGECFVYRMMDGEAMRVPRPSARVSARVTRRVESTSVVFR